MFRPMASQLTPVHYTLQIITNQSLLAKSENEYIAHLHLEDKQVLKKNNSMGTQVQKQVKARLVNHLKVRFPTQLHDFHSIVSRTLSSGQPPNTIKRCDKA